MRLPTGSMREFGRALDHAQPRWAKIYVGVIGLPAWAYLAYRTVTTDSLGLGRSGCMAVFAFASAVAVQMVVFARAFWRNDI